MAKDGWIIQNSNFFYKPTTNTNFQFQTITGPYVDLSQLCFDKNELENYLTNELVEENFGNGLRVLIFGLHIFSFVGEASEYFHGTEKLISSSTKRRSVHISRHFDYNYLLSLEQKRQWDFFKNTFKENMSLINRLKNVLCSNGDLLQHCLGYVFSVNL